MDDPCYKCGKVSDVLIATKETKNKVSNWACADCWWKTVSAKKKKEAAIKKMTDF
jgi:hypothetical protein